MSWLPQMLEGIKQNKTRMEIAAMLNIPVDMGYKVSAVSRAALRMLSSHEYREAGITNEQFAHWFERSLIGLRTADGELVIERTEPSEEQIADTLKMLQSKPSSGVCINPPPPPPGYKNCFICKRYGSYLCKYYNNNDNGVMAYLCKHYRRK